MAGSACLLATATGTHAGESHAADDATHADQVSQLSRELRQIRATRGQIEEEVGRAIQEIDTLLAGGR